MPSDLLLALLITLVGMGLVFGAILLLWLLMLALIALSRRPAQPEVADEKVERDLKRQAAAVAVGLALAEKDANRIREFPLPPTALVSAWQAVMRGNMLRKRGPLR